MYDVIITISRCHLSHPVTFSWVPRIYTLDLEIHNNKNIDKFSFITLVASKTEG